MKKSVKRKIARSLPVSAFILVLGIAGISAKESHTVVPYAHAVDTVGGDGGAGGGGSCSGSGCNSGGCASNDSGGGVGGCQG
jgi:hypothetical protein